MFYTRRGCHLCEEAKREIESAGARDRYTFEEIDVDTDAALAARYGLEIPVVRINGTTVFKYRLTAREFLRQLRKS
jgi:glutaredoxin